MAALRVKELQSLLEPLSVDDMGLRVKQMLFYWASIMCPAATQGFSGVLTRRLKQPASGPPLSDFEMMRRFVCTPPILKIRVIMNDFTQLTAGAMHPTDQKHNDKLQDVQLLMAAIRCAIEAIDKWVQLLKQGKLAANSPLNVLAMPQEDEFQVSDLQVRLAMISYVALYQSASEYGLDDSENEVCQFHQSHVSAHMKALTNALDGMLYDDFKSTLKKPKWVKDHVIEMQFAWIKLVDGVSCRTNTAVQSVFLEKWQRPLWPPAPPAPRKPRKVSAAAAAAAAWANGDSPHYEYGGIGDAKQVSLPPTSYANSSSSSRSGKRTTPASVRAAEARAAAEAAEWGTDGDGEVSYTWGGLGPENNYATAAPAASARWPADDGSDPYNENWKPDQALLDQM